MTATPAARNTAINCLKGFMAVSLFSTVPVRLYALSVSLQAQFASGITGIGFSFQDIGRDIIAKFNSPDGLLSSGTDFLFGFTFNPILMLFSAILMVYAVLKVFFANLKRGGILLIQISVGALYMFSVPRGYSDGFVQWCKQIIGLCLTAFLQTTILTAGLMVFNANALLGLGLVLSAGEVPRIAGAFGLDTSTKASFITGKTLGENGNDLDRMFLTASAITKAFHGDHAEHARHMKIDGVGEDTSGRVVHLSQREQRVIIEALVEQRERQETATSRTEQLLRRMTGSVTAYMDTVGRRPLYLSEYDKAVLAIRDGELDAFLGSYSKADADKLLPEVTGRPGAVGRRITRFLLEDVERFPEAVYAAACKKAIDINDPEKVKELLAKAADHVEGLSPSFHGEMAS